MWYGFTVYMSYVCVETHYLHVRVSHTHTRRGRAGVRCVARVCAILLYYPLHYPLLLCARGAGTPGDAHASRARRRCGAARPAAPRGAPGLRYSQSPTVTHYSIHKNQEIQKTRGSMIHMNIQYKLSATRGFCFSKTQSGGALVGDALLFLRAVRGERVSSALMATAAMTRPEPPSSRQP